MYRIIRYTIFILACLGAAIFRRKERLSASSTVALFFGCVLLSGLFSLLPIENVFFSFQSPDDVFSYMHREEPSFTIEGRESVLVVAKDERDSVVYEIIPKGKNGWVIPSITSRKRLVRGFFGSTHVQIYKCVNEDYYVLVLANGVNSIGDNRGSEFYCERHQVGGRSVTAAYTCVNNISEYSLFLDEEEVKIV